VTRALTDVVEDVVDRSTLETYAACPYQGWAIERGRVETASIHTEIGTEAHRILSDAIAARFDDGASADELQAMMHAAARQSRPDIQPEVIRALGGSPRMIAGLLTHRHGQERHQHDIMRFDGGDGDRAGQLAWEPRLDRPLVTGAVDLLLSTESQAELDLLDWKTGRTWFSAGVVANSFQFCLYSVLIFASYPACEVVNVRILMTRFSSMSPAVRFTRSRLSDYTARVLSALDIYVAHRDSALPPAWPHEEKCKICPACTACPWVRGEVRDFADDPAAGLQQLVSLEAATKKLRSTARGWWRTHGEIRSADLDIRFGVQGPAPKRRAPVPSLYHVQAEDPDTDTDTDQGNHTTCDTP